MIYFSDGTYIWSSENPDNKQIMQDDSPVWQDYVEYLKAEGEGYTLISTKSIDDLKQEIIDKVQNLIDDTAKARHYDNMNSVAKYLRPSSQFYSEAVALLDWTDSVWVKLYEIQANIGTTIPTIDEIIAQLPKFSEV